MSAFLWVNSLVFPHKLETVLANLVPNHPLYSFDGTRCYCGMRISPYKNRAEISDPSRHTYLKPKTVLQIETDWSYGLRSTQLLSRGCKYWPSSRWRVWGTLCIIWINNRMTEGRVGGMQMVFTTSYKGDPVLFDRWAPRTLGAFIGALIVIMLSAFCLRALIFTKSYLNAEHWGRSMVHHSLIVLREEKLDPTTISLSCRNQRMLLTFVMSLLGYGLMLVAMTYILVFSSFCVS